MRINKYLALKGYSSRRGADELLAAGLVKVNGKKAKVGQQITETDTVSVTGQKSLTSYTYLAYYKPVGVVTNAPSPSEKDILTSAKLDTSLNIQPVGRLDKESSGLILLTNDTRVVAPMLAPEKNHEKEYEVVVNEVLKRDFEEKISNGVRIKKYKTKPCTVSVKNKNTFSIVITEGKNRQVRRMCAALGYSVKNLKRVRIMHIQLGNLKKNSYREIKGEELNTLLHALSVE